ncbi:RsmE family RNA methyltransferase [Eubacteriales bacterium KG127]
MNIIFVDPSDVREKEILVTNPEDLYHLTKVLRVKLGQEITISDRTEWEYLGRVEEINEDFLSLSILDKQKHGRELPYQVDLFQGIPKSTKMELIVRKGVELGATRIFPVFMDRCVSKPMGKEGKKLQRLRKIAYEAVKQCMSPRLPEVMEFCDFRDALKILLGYDLVVFPYENETGRTVKDCLKEWKKSNLERHISDFGKSKIAVIIGPEGGFSDGEVLQLKNLGIEPVSLGKSIFRTETAGHATLAMIMYEFDL